MQQTKLAPLAPMAWATWAACAALILAGSPTARAQCPEWTPGFEMPGTDDQIAAGAVYDDGSGPALYVLGWFDYAGELPLNHVARWDGNGWSGVGGGLSNQVLAGDLEVFDDGSGPALYAAGDFNGAGGVPAQNLARWDGTAWADVGGGLQGPFVRARDLTSYDDGTGPGLYVTGNFSSAGGIPAESIARWDGQAWSPLGAGLANGSGVPIGLGLVVHDDGTGPALYVGGRFNSAGGLPVSNVARWDGTAWSPLGLGISGTVDALEAFGGDLYAAGSFTSAGGVAVGSIARWDGQAWSDVGGGTTYWGGIESLRVYDDGTVPVLVAGGGFTQIGAISAVGGIARWTGTQWNHMGAGAAGAHPSDSFRVYETVSYDEGQGRTLFALGDFEKAGNQPARHFARWDGTNWESETPGGGWVDGPVHSLEVFEDHLYVGGPLLELVSGVERDMIARWTGTAWSKFPSISGLNSFDQELDAFEVFEDELYATGRFRNATGPGGVNVNVFHIARFDGAWWADVGGGLGFNGSGHALLADGDQLFVGGEFSQAGGLAAANIARWDGSAWSDIGGTDGPVRALASFEEGGSSWVVAGGSFGTAGGVFANSVAAWDGTTWAAFGAGLPGTVEALAVFDDGSGPALFAAGDTATGIARWDGGAWVRIDGTGIDGTVLELASLTDGSGQPGLYAAGEFTQIDGATVNHVARWDGLGWTAVDGGADGVVRALASFDDGSAAWPPIYAGGDFQALGGLNSRRIGRLENTCACEGTAYCSAGTTASGCQASIASTGTASLSSTSGFVVTVTGGEGKKDGTLYFSTHGAQANPWGNGTSFQCVVPPVTRTGVLQGSGSANTCDGQFQLDFTAWIASKPAKAPLAGDTVYMQCWFRDPQSTSNQSTSLSDALRFSVCP